MGAGDCKGPGPDGSGTQDGPATNSPGIRAEAAPEEAGRGVPGARVSDPSPAVGTEPSSFSEGASRRGRPLAPGSLGGRGAVRETGSPRWQLCREWGAYRVMGSWYLLSVLYHCPKARKLLIPLTLALPEIWAVFPRPGCAPAGLRRRRGKRQGTEAPRCPGTRPR